VRLAEVAANRRRRQLSNVLLLTAAPDSAAEILPSLSLLSHATRIAPPWPSAVLGRPGNAIPAPTGAGFATRAGAGDSAAPDIVLVDARRDLVRVKDLLRQISGAGVPVLAVISEGAWAAVSADWGADDVILNTAGPGEVDARIRLAIARAPSPHELPADEVRSGELVIDEATYSARIRGAALDLTFKEFELLKFLAQHPRRVFTRSQLLQEVWGYDYFGGTRTVDVHVRRLRAKLGPENEALIGTVRNVGYKFVPASQARRGGIRGAGSNGADPASGARTAGASGRTASSSGNRSGQ
jgi:DNA-binding response OmpR family regulator